MGQITAKWRGLTLIFVLATVLLAVISLVGSHLAATAYTLASGAGEIWVYDTRNWQRVARGIGDKERTFRSIAWSPDGKLLASGGTDYVIKLWRFTP